jgi:hypothetical protein
MRFVLLDIGILPLLMIISLGLSVFFIFVSLKQKVNKVFALLVFIICVISNTIMHFIPDSKIFAFGSIKFIETHYKADDLRRIAFVSQTMLTKEETLISIKRAVKSSNKEVLQQWARIEEKSKALSLDSNMNISIQPSYVEFYWRGLPLGYWGLRIITNHSMELKNNHKSLFGANDIRFFIGQS